MNIWRDAPVETGDGEIGRVRNVVVDPDTREVTDLVVEGDGGLWLVPMRAVAVVEDDRVRLHDGYLHLYQFTAFEREAFDGVDVEVAQKERGSTALHGGLPLSNARENGVQIAGPDDTVLMQRPEFAGAGRTTVPNAPYTPPEYAARLFDAPTEHTPVIAAHAGSNETIDHDAVRTRSPRADHAIQDSDETHHIELKEEQLIVTTENVQAGVVRVSKRVTERIETVTMPVREERVVIEVLPGTGAVRIGDRVLQEGEVIEVPLLEQRLVVSKETVLREDVVVRKVEAFREEEVRETLRREELVVDQDGDLVTEDGAPAAEYDDIDASDAPSLGPPLERVRN